MIIKLIQPKMNGRPMDTDLKTRMAPSLALLTIAEMFYKEHKVIIENENIEEIHYDEPVDIVGITVTVDVMPRAVQIAGKFRESGIPVVAGGIHITAYPESSAAYFDAICVGMAETTWPQIIKDLQNNSLKKIYRCKDGIRGDEIISPAYDFIDRSKYLYTNVVSTSRGCPFQCDFCYNSCDAYKNLYINRPVKDVIKDIQSLGIKHVMFIDDNFIGNPAWTREFLQAVKPLKIKWNAAVSANIGSMPDLLDEMKDAGCQSLFIGFESLNENAVKNVHKRQNSVGKYESLVKEIHKRGIMINASFVFGLDGDDVSTFRTTLDWIVKNKIETVTSHILTPYPGTRVYDEFVQQNRIIDDDLSKYNTANVVFAPKNMTPQELYDGYLWIYKNVYSMKNIIKRIPESKDQRIPYLMFNLIYRKFGRITERMCNLVSFERIGRFARWISYHI